MQIHKVINITETFNKFFSNSIKNCVDKILLSPLIKLILSSFISSTFALNNHPPTKIELINAEKMKSKIKRKEYLK